MFRLCVHQEILNHCFDDVERFMGRLQQTAEAQTVLNQRKKKGSKKSKKEKQDSEIFFFINFNNGFNKDGKDHCNILCFRHPSTANLDDSLWEDFLRS